MTDTTVASVRPKVRGHPSEVLMKPNGDPLEKRSIKFEDRDGIQRNYSAMHNRFSHTMVFPKYILPPIQVIIDLKFKGVNAEEDNNIQNWILNVESFEEMVKTLLDLSHNQFWSTLVNENAIQISLESYLRFAPRDYDLHNFMITDRMKSAVSKVHSVLFKLYLRMSSNIESKSRFIGHETFANIIYDNYLFDVQKIMNLCVIYGNSSVQNLLNKMMSNIIQSQPKYLNDLTKSCDHIHEVLNFIQDKLGVNDYNQTSRFEFIQWSDLQHIVAKIVDLSVSINSLIKSIPQMANIYRTSSIDRAIVEFYNKVLPSLQREIDKRLTEDTLDLMNGIKRQILIARSGFIQTFRDIIQIFCFQPLFDESVSLDQKLILIDQLLDSLILASDEKSFITDYCKQYPIEKDFTWLSQNSSLTKFSAVDKARTDYLISLVESYISSNQQLTEATNEVKVEPQVNGDIGYEDMNGVNVELESQFQYIREIIPDLGNGFIEKCLEYYDFDNEKVLNAILEDNLPPQLSNLDRSLQKVQKIGVNSVPNKTEIRLKESIDTKASVPQVLENRQNVYDNDEFDIFRNKNVDLSRIHKGKKDKNIGNIDEITKEKIMSIHYKSLEDQQNENYSCYNDEYDDTYDDNQAIDLPNDKLIDELQDKQNKFNNNNDDNNESNSNTIDEKVVHKSNRGYYNNSHKQFTRNSKPRYNNYY